MDITVGSAKALQSALLSAKPGDTILLKSGSYGALRIEDLDGVTVKAAPGATPVFTGVKIDGADGVSLVGLEIDLGRGGDFAVLRSVDITLTGLDVHGALDGKARKDPDGLLIRFSNDVTITDSEFSHLAWGIGHQDVQGLVVRDSAFHHLQVDGIRGGGSSKVAIVGNTFTDFFPGAKEHPDAIQFWTTHTKSSARDILIEGNSFVRGDGEQVQGIFFRDQVGDLPYENVVIRGNLVAGASYNGIMVNGGRNVVVEDNIVQGFADEKSWIRLRDVEGGRVTDNSTNLTIIEKSRGVTESGTELLALARDEGAAAVQAWLAGSANGGSTPDPVANRSDTASSPSLLEGDADANALRGDAGDNLLRGREGRDTLDGGAGDDVLVGGEGVDRFVFGPGSGADRIRDFGAHSDRDVIDASALLKGGAEAALSQTVHGVTIAFSTGESIFLEKLTLADLSSTSTGWIAV